VDGVFFEAYGDWIATGEACSALDFDVQSTRYNISDRLGGAFLKIRITHSYRTFDSTPSAVLSGKVHNAAKRLPITRSQFRLILSRSAGCTTTE